MPKILIFLIAGILIVVAAVLFIVMPPGESDLSAPAPFGKTISMPMPKPPPEPVETPEVTASGDLSGNVVDPQKDDEVAAAASVADGKAEAVEKETAAAAADMADEKAGAAEKETAAEAAAVADEKAGAAEKETAAEAAAVADEKAGAAEKETAAEAAAVADEKAEGVKKEEDRAAPPEEIRITRKLRDVEVQTYGGRTDIIILTDGPLQAAGSGKGFKYFFLSDPERLVVDLTGGWADPASNGKPVGNDLIQKLRFWKYPEKLRIVCDLKEKTPLSLSFMATPDGLIITLTKNIEEPSETLSAQTE